MGKGGGGKAKAKSKTLTQTVGGKGSPSGSYLLASQYATKGQKIPTRPGRVISPVTDFGPDLGGGGGGEAAEDPRLEVARQAAEAAREQAAQSAALAAELKRNTDAMNQVMAVSAREAWQVVADVISGNIAGSYGQRARTASDGFVLARLP